MPTYCKVKRTLLAQQLDSWDADTLPESAPLHGNITFTPQLADGDAVTLYDNGKPVTIVPAPIKARISDGQIFHRGVDYIELLAGGDRMNPATLVWKATFTNLQANGTLVKLRPVVFEAVPDGTVDLTIVAPAPGTAGQGVVKGRDGDHIEGLVVEGTNLVLRVKDGDGVTRSEQIAIGEVAKTVANDAVTRAETAATSATESASMARSSEDTATAKAAASGASASAAAGSESVAVAKAGEANASAQAAKVSEDAAKASETAAAGSASAVASDRAAAGVSATAAKSSEDAAKSSELAAGQSETSAASSATASADARDSAQAYAGGAQTQAQAAQSSAGTATSKAGEASLSASVAKDAEGKAKDSETNAAASADSANESKDDAAASAAAAKLSEDNAKASETAAETSETNAASSAATAVSARDSAQASADTAESQAHAAQTQGDRAQTEADRAATSAAQAAETASSGIPDATASMKGKVMLAGDLGGTADAPTVPKLASKADLVGGQVPTSQLPSVALVKPNSVADRAGMLALTAQEGDVAVITSGADKGTYMLGSGSPATFGSWVKLVSPDAPVQSVNGQTGTVNLDAASVGAAPVSHTHKVEQVTGLQSALNDKASTTAVNARPALFSGAGAPPATIAGAVVGDWWLDTSTMELHKITGV